MVHEIGVSIYSWKPILLISSRTQIPFTTKMALIYQHETLYHPGRRAGLLEAWRIRRGLPQGRTQIGEGLQLVPAVLARVQVNFKPGLLVCLEGALGVHQ
ncbi:MAG: hypothetical protein ACRERE_44440 [Candidatus Entotheonellia bacterium]